MILSGLLWNYDFVKTWTSSIIQTQTKCSWWWETSETRLFNLDLLCFLKMKKEGMFVFLLKKLFLQPWFAIISFVPLFKKTYLTFLWFRLVSWQSYRNGKPESSVICQYVCHSVLFVQPIRSLIWIVC